MSCRRWHLLWFCPDRKSSQHHQEEFGTAGLRVAHLTLKEISLLLKSRCKPKLIHSQQCPSLFSTEKQNLLAAKPNSSKLILKDQFNHRFGQTRNKIWTAHVFQDVWSLSYEVMIDWACAHNESLGFFHFLARLFYIPCSFYSSSFLSKAKFLILSSVFAQAALKNENSIWRILVLVK